jgi:hypothetical protein
MLKIFIGAHRDVMLVGARSRLRRPKKTPPCIVIPEPGGSPTELEWAIAGFRHLSHAGYAVFVTTNNAFLIDLALPTEVWLMARLDPRDTVTIQVCANDLPQVKEAWDVGIEHLSEILRTRGVWK